MKQYKVVFRSDFSSSTDAKIIEDYLNKMASEGWGLIKIQDYVMNCLYYFEKEL